MKKFFLLPLFLVGAAQFANAQTATTTTAGSTAGTTSGMQTTNGPVMTFTVMEYNFGNIKQGDVVHHDFYFKNTGKEPLIINNAQGSCGCTVPAWPHEPIKPNGSDTIKVTFNSAGKMGPQDKTVTITYDTDKTIVLHLKGTVDAPAQQAPTGGTGTITPAGGTPASTATPGSATISTDPKATGGTSTTGTTTTSGTKSTSKKPKN